MAYTIGYVILGIDLGHSEYSNTPDPWAAHRSELYKALNGEPDDTKMYGQTDPIKGFEARYSGGGDQPAWFGLELGQFDECTAITGEEMIALCTPSMDKILEYDALVGETNANMKLSVKLRAALASTKARVHIVWGTS